MSDLLETLAKSSADRAYVLPLSRYGYLTVAQLVWLFQAGSPNYVRERLEDLRRRGLVERIRPMRVGSGGKRAYVYFLTNEGQAAARALLDLPEERYRQSEREAVGTCWFLDHTLQVNSALIHQPGDPRAHRPQRQHSRGAHGAHVEKKTRQCAVGGTPGRGHSRCVD